MKFTPKSEKIRNAMPWKCAHGSRNVLSISNTYRLMSWGRGARRNVPQMHWILRTEGIFPESPSDTMKKRSRGCGVALGKW